MSHMLHVPHQVDQAVLESLVVDFVTRRLERRVSRRGLAAALGVNHASVFCLERRRPSNPMVRTLREYAEPLGLDLRIDLRDLPEVEPSPSVDLLRRSGYLGTATICYLRQVREHLGISRMQIQAEHGWKWSSQASCENSDREPLMSTIQRFARCLGGRAIPRWEEL